MIIQKRKGATCKGKTVTEEVRSGKYEEKDDKKKKQGKEMSEKKKFSDKKNSEINQNL